MTLDEYLKHRAGPGPRPHDAPQDEHDKALVRAFADKIGVSDRTVYRYLTGERFPHPDVMRQIIKVTEEVVGPMDFLQPEEADEVRSQEISSGVTANIGRPMQQNRAEVAHQAHIPAGAGANPALAISRPPSHRVYYKRWIHDYLFSTGHLTLLEHGAFTLLLDWAYWTEQPLPKDEEGICSIIRAITGEEKDAVRRILQTFWTLTDKGWINPRVEKEIRNIKAERNKAALQRRIRAHREWARQQLPHLLSIQENRCRLCNQPFAQDDSMDVDHIRPLTKFHEQLERRDLNDLQATHAACHRRKRDWV